jgi:hypothetical protein
MWFLTMPTPGLKQDSIVPFRTGTLNYKTLFSDTMKVQSDKQDRLREAIQLCAIHYERMSFAYGKIEKYFPLTRGEYSSLDPVELSFFDQLIFRFSRLQDGMGGKLFPALLESLGEEVRGVPFIDLLTKLEELNLLDDSKNWLILRETRNILNHEYPFITEEVIEGLNQLSDHYLLIASIWKRLEQYANQRFKFS